MSGEDASSENRDVVSGTNECPLDDPDMLTMGRHRSQSSSKHPSAEPEVK